MAGRLELAGRTLLTGLVKILIPARSEFSWSWTENDPERILLVRHDDRIGNLIMLKPLMQGVRSTWPEAEIGVLIGPKFARVYQEEPEVDILWILEKRRILRNPFLFFSLIRQLRRHDYQIAIDCSHMHSFSLTGASLTYFSGAPVRVAYERENAASFCNLLVEPLRAEHHESEILLNLLRPFVVEFPETAIELHLSDEEREWAEGVREEILGGMEVLVGIHVGGRGSKKWPLDRFRGLIERITDLYRVAIVVLCGPGEEEEAGEIRAGLGERVSVFEDLDLRQMLSLVAHCDFFICPDTGPMHAAVAFGVPTVAVFLEDTWRRYGPSGPLHRIVLTTPVDGENEVLEAFAGLVRERFRVIDDAGEDGRGDGEDADT